MEEEEFEAHHAVRVFLPDDDDIGLREEDEIQIATRQFQDEGQVPRLRGDKRREGNVFRFIRT